ncbi:HlyD family secretion protein [Hydrogenophaga sp.]|uniref:HlyD family secretion protein n=1 Tax=Hydrogenophaga sp. TaxID=1904254 RepID=UPI003562D727
MPSSPPPTERLFRDEVLDHQRVQSLGSILLTPRLSSLWIAAVAALLALALVLFVALGSHTRRVTVNGQLLPVGGLIRVHTPQAGVVQEKHVAEGQLVEKGTVLYVLSSDRVGEGSNSLQADIQRQIGERKRSLQTEIARAERAQQEEQLHLQRRLQTLRGELQTIASLIEQQKDRLQMAEDTRKRYQGLADQDYIAREELQQKRIDASEQRSRLRTLERDQLGVQREMAQVSQELDGSRQRHANQTAELQRNVSSAEQELTEAETRRQVVITAPESGRATLVTAELGQTVDGNQALVTLIPAAAPLQARLYAPSSSIGFVQPGDVVLLRYQAFPYQKYGQQEGVVESVSTSALRPTELQALPVAGLPEGEPVFSVLVRLKSSTVWANGQARALQAGMQLQADILQETRQLYEWMLEPLYSVTRRQQP